MRQQFFQYQGFVEPNPAAIELYVAGDLVGTGDAWDASGSVIGGDVFDWIQQRPDSVDATPYTPESSIVEPIIAGVELFVSGDLQGTGDAWDATGAAAETISWYQQFPGPIFIPPTWEGGTVQPNPAAIELFVSGDLVGAGDAWDSTGAAAEVFAFLQQHPGPVFVEPQTPESFVVEPLTAGIELFVSGDLVGQGDAWDSTGAGQDVIFDWILQRPDWVDSTPHTPEGVYVFPLRPVIPITFSGTLLGIGHDWTAFATAPEPMGWYVQQPGPIFVPPTVEGGTVQPNPAAIELFVSGDLVGTGDAWSSTAAAAEIFSFLQQFPDQVDSTPHTPEGFTVEPFTAGIELFVSGDLVGTGDDWSAVSTVSDLFLDWLVQRPDQVDSTPQTPEGLTVEPLTAGIELFVSGDLIGQGDAWSSAGAAAEIFTWFVQLPDQTYAEPWVIEGGTVQPNPVAIELFVTGDLVGSGDDWSSTGEQAPDFDWFMQQPDWFPQPELVTEGFTVQPFVDAYETIGTWNFHGGPILFTESHWAAMDFVFEAYLGASAGTVYARAYDVTAGAAVADSQVSSASVTYERVRSGFLTLIDGHEYRAQAALGTGAAGSIYDARLIGTPA